MHPFVGFASNNLRANRTLCAAEADLDRVVTTDRRAGPVAERAGTPFPHLSQHWIHHRGQAHVQLGQAGIAPPQLDEVFLVHDRAATAGEYPR